MYTPQLNYVMYQLVPFGILSRKMALIAERPDEMGFKFHTLSQEVSTSFVGIYTEET